MPMAQQPTRSIAAKAAKIAGPLTINGIRLLSLNKGRLNNQLIWPTCCNNKLGLAKLLDSLGKVAV